jgi:hypothetical protein
MAAIDWDAAIAALHAGELPCSGGERRVLELSSSLAGGTPVDLRDAVTGLDDGNITRQHQRLYPGTTQGQYALGA